MSNIILFNLKKKILKSDFDYYYYIWFNYHVSFFGSLILNGNKLAAFKILQQMKKYLKIIEGYDPYIIFLAAVFKLMPNILLRSIRQGAVSKGLPMYISEHKQKVCVVQWTVKLLKGRRAVKGQALAELLVSALYDGGESFEAKMQVYQTALDNRHLIRFYK